MGRSFILTLFLVVLLTPCLAFAQCDPEIAWSEGEPTHDWLAYIPQVENIQYNCKIRYATHSYAEGRLYPKINRLQSSPQVCTLLVEFRGKQGIQNPTRVGSCVTNSDGFCSIDTSNWNIPENYAPIKATVTSNPIGHSDMSVAQSCVRSFNSGARIKYYTCQNSDGERGLSEVTGYIDHVCTLNGGGLS